AGRFINDIDIRDQRKVLIISENQARELIPGNPRSLLGKVVKVGEMAFTVAGIEKEDNAWLYIIGNGKECWIFAKNQLQSLFRKVKQNPIPYREKGITLRTHIDKDTNKPTANGMCVSLYYIESNNLAINHIVFRKDYTQWIKNTTL
ncbi:ABC transporter permease, partial [bacterium]|nr:ABC transporter permease [bacterium]